MARLTTPAQALAPVRGRGFGLGALVAGYARSLGFAVWHDPLPGNPAHSLIVGQNSRTLSRLQAAAIFQDVGAQRDLAAATAVRTLMAGRTTGAAGQ